MKRVFWGILGGIGALWGCGSVPLDDAGEEAPPSEQSAEVVLGFESANAWHVAGRPPRSVGSLGQGSAALEVFVSGRTVLQSAPFTFERTPNDLALTVRRTGGTEPSASLAASLSCDAKGVARVELGSVALSRREVAERVAFAVPREVRDRLADGCGDLRVELELQEPRGATYELDAMSLRAATPPLGRDGSKLCGLPNAEHLVRAAVQTPEGHWDYQEWLARPSIQAEMRPLQEALAPFAAVALEPAFDDVNQRIIVPVDQEAFDSGVVDDALVAAQLDLPLQVQPACHSVQDLKRAGEVLAARSWHEDAIRRVFDAVLEPGRGAWVATFDPSSEPEALDTTPPAAIRSLRPDAKAVLSASSLREKVGDRVIIEWGTPRRTGRLNDSERHYGGAGIGTANQSANCSSGFVVRRGGLMGSVTAAHCFFDGSTLFSGPFKYGKTSGRQPFPQFDMLRIDPDGQTYTNVIHTGPSAPVTRSQIGKADPPVGALVCFSGMTTGAICGALVTSTNAQFCDFAGCTNGLVSAQRLGVALAQSGDSGGPVYTRSGQNGAFINGMIVAGRPLGIGLFHRVSDIERQLGVTVATSP